MRKFKIIFASTCIFLSLVGCGAKKASSDQFASVLSGHVSTLHDADVAFAQGWTDVSYKGAVDDSMMPAYQAELQQGILVLVAECTNVLKDLNALGEPAGDISDLVARTKDAMTTCQTMSNQTDLQQLDSSAAPQSRILESWAPYGVPQK